MLACPQRIVRDPISFVVQFTPAIALDISLMMGYVMLVDNVNSFKGIKEAAIHWLLVWWPPISIWASTGFCYAMC